MNQNLVAILEELRSIMEMLGEVYRERAYRKAIISIKKLPYEITKNTLPQFQEGKTPGIGASIAAKIAEFITRGKVADLDKLRRSKEVQAHKIFSKILGVGPAKIQEFISKKVYDLPGLRRAVATEKVQLTHIQKLGLKYMADLNERIPRAEVTALGELFRRRFERILPGIRFEISGSYRRGAPTSGDIDIIITHDKYNKNLLERFSAELAEDENFIDVISAGEQRLTFLYRGPAKVRQIDILWIPIESYWAAVCYFTGDYEWNQYMREIAKKKGYRLNQLGLYKIRDGNLELIPVKNEEEIFNILGIPWRRPEERNGH